MEEVNPRDRILHYFTYMEGPRKTCEDAEKYSSHCSGCVERGKDQLIMKRGLFLRDFLKLHPKIS